MSTLPFPASLRTVTPADGHALARHLAAQALAERAASRAHLSPPRTPPALPSVEALTAAYFQAVAAVNSGWSR